MAWSWSVGRLFGIEVRLHITFVLALAALGIAQLVAGGPMAMATGLAFGLALFGSVLLHEFGHALTARRYGVATRDITLLPIGGVASLERMPRAPRAELAIALAGPAVNVAIAALLAGALVLGDGLELSPAGAAVQAFGARLLAVNVALAVFNLVPAFPMDGGRVLRALLATRLSFARATRIASRLGRGLALGFAALGLFSNPMLVLVAAFVWFAAGRENEAVALQESLGARRAGAHAQADLPTLAADEGVGEAARRLTLLGLSAAPVVSAGALVGIATRRRLLEAVARQGPLAPVSAAIEEDIVAVAPEDSLAEALARASTSGAPLVAVADGGRLLGFLATDRLVAWAAYERALESFGERRPGASPTPATDLG